MFQCFTLFIIVFFKSGFGVQCARRPAIVLTSLTWLIDWPKLGSFARLISRWTVKGSTVLCPCLFFLVFYTNIIRAPWRVCMVSFVAVVHWVTSVVCSCLTRHGVDHFQSFHAPLWQEADEDLNGWVLFGFCFVFRLFVFTTFWFCCHLSRIGCCRKDNYSLQAEARRDCHNNTHHRFQCWDCRVQEYLLHSVGCWRAG